jgi:arsenical pump membrane protein
MKGMNIMHPFAVFLTVTSFILTVTLIMWRPRGMNEAIPAMCGATLVLISGTVTWKDLLVISETVGGAAITILSTIAMAIVLESFGFFQYAAEVLARRTKNSGIRLFWYVNLFCFLMTLFFNNDGSILITTPILLLLLQKLRLKPHQQIPYLMSGALVATASSAPIGVSNIVNLISLKIVGMSLVTFTAMMFVPAMMGLGILGLLNYLVLRKELTPDLSANTRIKPNYRPVHHDIGGPIAKPHPHSQPRRHHKHHPNRRDDPVAPSSGRLSDDTFHALPKQRDRFMRNIFLYVLLVRISLFVASYFGVPVSVAAIFGAVVLLVWRWMKLGIPPTDILRKTPWHILVFAFGMYVVIYGLHKSGLTTWLVHFIQPFIVDNWLHAVVTMGILVSIMSNLFNNHPALMIGTLTLTNMQLDPMTMKVAYLGNVIGSDIGSLILPVGLLATLIWMHILKQHHLKVSWRRYVGLTAIVIPITVIATVLLVYAWVWLIYG